MSLLLSTLYCNLAIEEIVLCRHWNYKPVLKDKSMNVVELNFVLKV